MLYVQFLSITSQSLHDNLCSMLVAQAAGDRNSVFFFCLQGMRGELGALGELFTVKQFRHETSKVVSLPNIIEQGACSGS